MTNHPNRSKPWIVLTYQTSTSQPIRRTYATQDQARRYARAQHDKKLIALVEHKNDQPAASHWRE